MMCRRQATNPVRIRIHPCFVKQYAAIPSASKAPRESTVATQPLFALTMVKVYVFSSLEQTPNDCTPSTCSLPCSRSNQVATSRESREDRPARGGEEHKTKHTKHVRFFVHTPISNPQSPIPKQFWAVRKTKGINGS